MKKICKQTYYNNKKNLLVEFSIESNLISKLQTIAPFSVFIRLQLRN